jgi:hypothetical protein
VRLGRSHALEIPARLGQELVDGATHACRVTMPG